jgi:type IV secretory pathway VirB10-like protein
MAEEKQAHSAPTPESQSAPSPENAPGLRDRRVRPEGVVPKQAQGYVIAGLAVLILMAVMFSKNHARPTAKVSDPSLQAASTDMNQQKIQELEQDLSADQRQSQQRQTRSGNPLNAPASNGNTTQSNGAASSGAEMPQPTTEPQRDPVVDAERALAFRARFASNLVVSDDNASRPSAKSAGSADDAPARPSNSAQTSTAPATVDGKRAPEVNLNSALGQPYVVFEGTTIDTVLVNRLDGEFAGPVKVMVTDPIYSQDGQHLLIAEGTFILGDLEKVAGLGQKRLAVTFHRLLMPDGYSVDLDQFHGLDQAGSTGLRDKVNNHYVEIFGASIALGVIAGAAEATNLNQGFDESGTEAYKSGVASGLSQSSANVLDRFINIPPNLTIREGHRIKVYITQDLLLPAYEAHTIPANF